MSRSALLCVLLFALGTARASESAVKVGSTIDKLTFKDIRYLTRSLNDFPKSRAYVLVFTTATCPLVQRYLPTLNKLEKDYRARHVQFVSVNAGDDSIRALAALAVEYDVAFPCVKDADGSCVAALGVTRTPQVVVLDADRKLRYRGRIDDQYRIGGTLPQPTRHDLKEALDAVLAGKPVAVAETTVDGCLITRTEMPSANGAVTYADHVAPIVNKHCVECHRPNTVAPFALMSYEQVAAKAHTIAEVVHDERMPPWYASPKHVEFVNRRGLTADERTTIQQWVKGGKLKGDESKLPRQVVPEESEWRIGKPDLIVKAPEHDLPAEGVVDYKYVVLPHVFLTDTWVQGVQIKPDNPRVLHHCNMAYIKLGDKFRMDNFITGTVPGGEPMVMDEKVGFRLPKGSMLVLQVHYVTTGKKEKCQISVGFKYASGTVDKHLRFHLLVDNKFAIPPGEPAHRVAASRVLKQDSVGVGLFTHMHVRGRDMTFKAHYPDGKSETLLVVPNYNFDWQMAYRWAPGTKRLPKGTRLEAIAHYDNSAFNPFNPDPKATVRDGQQTFHEMMNGFVFFVDADEKLGLKIDGKTGREKP